MRELRWFQNEPADTEVAAWAKGTRFQATQLTIWELTARSMNRLLGSEAVKAIVKGFGDRTVTVTGLKAETRAYVLNTLHEIHERSREGFVTVPAPVINSQSCI